MKSQGNYRDSAGNSYLNHENSETAGARGPILLQDYILQENLAHFVRENIPQRIVHAKGAGAFGKFTVTRDLSPYTRAKLFSKAGNQCKVFVRFSTTRGGKDSADTERDPRGFAVKFYTQDGNWDLAASSSPVFYVKDAKKFPDLMHAQMRCPSTHLRSNTNMWDYWSLNPETLHQVMMLMSDRGIPYGYRHMHGYGVNTFSLINDKNERVWVKFHLKSKQGIRNFTAKEAAEMRAENPDFAQEDLISAILEGNAPSWTLYLQIMTEEQAQDFRWNPFDVTKVWPHAEFPLLEAGLLTLNELPEDYFAQVEQSAFSPHHLIDGIGFSPDRILQGRIFSTPDAQRYRLGINASTLPVNAPLKKPHNYQQRGPMQTDVKDFKKEPSYAPSHTAKSIRPETSAKAPGLELDAVYAGTFDRNLTDNDHYTQPGIFYRKILNEQEKQNLIDNIIQHMSKISGEHRDEIVNLQICHFFRADTDLGLRIAKGLNVEIDPSIMRHRMS